MYLEKLKKARDSGRIIEKITLVDNVKKEVKLDWEDAIKRACGKFIFLRSLKH
jgi:hypothetical protein